MKLSLLQNPLETLRWLDENAPSDDPWSGYQQVINTYAPETHVDEPETDLCALCGEPFTGENPKVYEGETSEYHILKGVCFDCASRELED